MICLSSKDNTFCLSLQCREKDYMHLPKGKSTPSLSNVLGW